MNLLTLFFLGVALSIDAFSVSISCGLLNISNKKILISSAIVGFFHFLMPLLGYLTALPFVQFIDINSKYIVVIPFILIIIEMLKSLKEKSKELTLNTLGIVLFAFFVSIDSFSVGMGISFVTNNIIVANTMFSIISASFTFMGMKIGKFLNKKIGDISKIIGILILIILVFYFLFK